MDNSAYGGGDKSNGTLDLAPELNSALAKQHGECGDQLMELGAYRAAKSHYLQGQAIVDKYLSTPSESLSSSVEFKTRINSSSQYLPSQRFSDSITENDERFLFERLNLAALVALDRGRYHAACEIIDAILSCRLDNENRQHFQTKKSRIAKMTSDRDNIIDIASLISGPLLALSNQAMSRQDFVLGLLILISGRDAYTEAIAYITRNTAATLSSDQQTKLAEQLNEADKAIANCRTALVSSLPSRDKLISKIDERIRHELEDVQVMLDRQDINSDRDALLRPSIVVDMTMEGKLSAAKQSLMLMRIIDPEKDQIKACIDILAELSSRRHLICERRHISGSQLIYNRIKSLCDCLEPGPDPVMAQIVKQMFLRFADSYHHNEHHKIDMTSPIRDSDYIVDEFMKSWRVDKQMFVSSESRFRKMLAQAQQHLAAARGRITHEHSIDYVEEQLKISYDIFNEIVDGSKTLCPRSSTSCSQSAQNAIQICGQMMKSVACRRESLRCMQSNDKSGALKWMVQAGHTSTLDDIEDDIMQVGDLMVSQFRARGNLVAGISALDRISSIGNQEYNVDQDQLISGFIRAAQRLDSKDSKISLWSKAYRLRCQAAAIFVKKDYKRVKAILEECSDLIPDSEIFRRDIQDVDSFVYKDELQSAAERLQSRNRRSRNKTKPSVESLSNSSQACASPSSSVDSQSPGFRNKLINGILDEVLGKEGEDRIDYLEAIQSVLLTHPGLEETDISDNDWSRLKSHCVDGLNSIFGHSMADVENVIRQQTCVWMINRSKSPASEKYRRQRCLKIAVRCIKKAYKIIGVGEIDLDIRLLGRIQSSLMDNYLSIGDDNAAHDIEFGHWIGDELGSIWFPDVASSQSENDDDAMAKQLVLSWIERNDILRRYDPNIWTQIASEILAVCRSKLQGFDIVEPIMEKLRLLIEHNQSWIISDLDLIDPPASKVEPISSSLSANQLATVQIPSLSLQSISAISCDSPTLPLPSFPSLASAPTQSASSSLPSAASLSPSFSLPKSVSSPPTSVFSATSASMSSATSPMQQIAKSIIGSCLVDYIFNTCRLSMPSNVSLRTACFMVLPDLVMSTLNDETLHEESRNISNLINIMSSILQKNTTDDIDVWCHGIRYAFYIGLNPNDIPLIDAVQARTFITSMSSALYVNHIMERTGSKDMISDMIEFQRDATRLLSRYIASDQLITERLTENPFSLCEICQDLVDQIIDQRNSDFDSAQQETPPVSEQTDKAALSAISTSSREFIANLRRLVLIKLLPVDANKSRGLISSWIDDVLTRALSADAHARFINNLLVQSQRTHEYTKQDIVNRIVRSLKPFIEGETEQVLSSYADREALTAKMLNSIKRAIVECKTNLRG